MNIMSIKNKLQSNNNALFLSRSSISLLYFVSGLIFASWASRIPDIKNLLHLTDGELGKILFAIPIGQLSMMFVSGYLVTKLGSRHILLFSIILYALVLVSLSFMGSINSIFIALLLFGIAANMVNISLNTQACALESRYDRNIMSSFHGLWSLGGLTGGIIGAVFVHLGYSISTHYISIAILCVMLVALGSKYLLDDKPNPQREVTKTNKGFFKLDMAIILLGLIGFGGMFCEGTMFDWSSVYFAKVIQPDDSFIRLGYIASMGTMTMGRFFADRFVTKYQATAVLKFCGLLIVSGLLLAVVYPSLLTSTLGFMLVGLGVSSVVPICYSVAGRLGHISASMAITMVSSISFLGFMIGPPLIGMLSEITNLRMALGIASSFGLLITIFAERFQILQARRKESNSLSNLG